MKEKKQDERSPLNRGMKDLLQRNIIYLQNNWHSYCSYVHNKMKYQDNTIISICIMFTKSKYVSWVHILKTYIGYLLL